MSAVTLEGVLSRLTSEQLAGLARRQTPEVRARIEAVVKGVMRVQLAELASRPVRRVPVADLAIIAGSLGSRARAHIKGLRLTYTLNSRAHWSAKARAVDYQRAAVRHAFEGVALPSDPTRVLIVREGPVLLDSDNLVGACKAARDEIAALCGIDDGPGGPVTWVAEQIRERGYGVRIEITGGAR